MKSNRKTNPASTDEKTITTTVVVSNSLPFTQVTFLSSAITSRIYFLTRVMMFTVVYRPGGI